MKKRIFSLMVMSVLLLSGCTSNASVDTTEEIAEKSVMESSSASVMEQVTLDDEEEVKMELSKNYKTRGNTNPIITQDFGADPYAMVYNDTIYFFMTADAFEYDADGTVKENSYSKIRSIHLVSTKDMKNFTDHGLIPVAGKDGIAKWANNSWAPAACWKNIDGKDKFFLYFADNGGGIGVLTADSPEGPYTDPLGHGLITRDVPNCANVLWLFDPAVLVDDDGTGYLYFGGGVPEGKVSDPGTGRVVRLGDDMISLACDPVAIDVPYLFEDSGIHKLNNKYYYSYCTNWSVDKAGTEKYGFTNAQIVTLVSDSPMGPFTFNEIILDNPGILCGLYGNNHHAVFEFKDKWYITYHSRMLEKKMEIEHGYRSTCISEIRVKEDGSFGRIAQNYEGPDQLILLNPFEEQSAVCVASMAGTNAVPYNAEIAYGKMVLGEIETGDYVEIDGVDFSIQNATEFVVKVNKAAGGKIHVRTDFPNKEDICTVDLSKENENGVYTVKLDKEVSKVTFLYLVFEGEGFEVESWKFN